MMKPHPTRKANRLSDYDYSLPGYYFITFCTEEREPLLGRVVECDEQAEVLLSLYGQAAKEAIERIPQCYPGVRVDKYVIMPNHVHLLLVLESTDDPERIPTISRIVQQLKGVITKRLGKNIWQIHFHDHVIRSEQDYREIWQYIDNNPTKWSLDRYYTP